MKLKQKFIVRCIAGEYIAVPVKSGEGSLEGVVTMNETGASILKLLEEDVQLEHIVASITQEYETDAETAVQDVTEFIARLRELDLISE